MNTAQASDSVENLGEENWLRFFRKHLYRFLHVLVAAPVGLQVQDTVGGIMRRDISPETVRDVDHAQRQIRGMGDACGGDGPAVFEAPILLRIAAGKLALDSQALGVHKKRRFQVAITPAQNDMGAGLGVQVGLGDNDDMHWMRPCLVQALPLLYTGLRLPLHSG